MKTSMVVTSVAAGVLAAVLIAPLFHTHGDPGGRIVPMWAHAYATLQDMTVDADTVVLATVTGTRPGRVVSVGGGASLLPFTLIDLTVDETVRGQASEVLTVEQTGGILDGLTAYMEDDGGPYRVGDEVLLFLKAQPGTGYYYVSHPKGRFTVDGNTLRTKLPADAVAAELAGRDLDDALHLIEAAGR